ncbi:hypothetical protein BDV30DRAFT_231983 [Aspergillus minisclerotigenes]|uniref:Uncharacterized protein n=1 Tax=Aspergillus minisclerotigenes TaxID=656917 RepID=A0A5N6IM73_9EURO|nr:hypothetical protein BDV30DRAFT_231983 [Aspergillus minisclerotigenes]
MKRPTTSANYRVQFSKGTYRRWWSFTRRRGWWWWAATRAVVHRWHARWGRRNSHARGRSPRCAHARNRRSVSTISAIAIRSLSTRRGRRGLLLLLPGCSSRGSVSALRAISIIASTAALSPWGCASLVTRSIVVTGAVVSASLLPRSHITGRWPTLPRLRITVVVTLIGTGFDAARDAAIFTRSSSRQFLHELLEKEYYSTATTTTVTTIVTPIGASLAVRTITSHVTSVATNTTDDVGGKVALFWTVILAMSDLTT